MDSDYYLNFENKFRGDREKILKIFSAYDPLIDLAIEDKVLPVLIDIGCGRGEWLQRCKNKFYQSIGIESDEYMVKTCRKHGLTVLEGDAVDELSKFDNDSIAVITIFHVIEHLEYSTLIQLISECHRVLRDDGLLIMETPSIDNLIVSTKLFYIDHTHINPINAEAISFHLEKAGFSNVKNYYINGGPLQDASPVKITRVFNGVAQDLCIISTKSEIYFNKIFTDSNLWESNLNIGLTLFQAAIEFDTKLESLMKSFKVISSDEKYSNEILKEEIILLKNEISSLKSRLSIFTFINKVIIKIKNIIIFLFKSIKNRLIVILYKIFNTLLNLDLIKNILISENFYLVIKTIFKLIGNTSNSQLIKIRTRLRKILEDKARFNTFNSNLLFHYEKSNKSKKYLNLLNRGKK